MHIGFVGLGNMGVNMADNLLRAGHQLTVYNRTPNRAESLRAAGARVAQTPAQAAAADLIITMLADDRAVEQVLTGSDGLLSAMRPGSIHLSMSTISVELAVRLTSLHQEHGQVFFSAPVFGRPEAAAAGKLFIVAAGAGDIAERLQPVFGALGQRTFYMGAKPSMANVVKLSGNFLIASMIESLGEAFALTRKHGIAPETYLDVLTNSLFSAPVYKTYGGLIARDQFEPVGFRLKLGLKDIRLALQAAEDVAVPMPVASIVRDRFLSGMANGLADADWSSIARLAAESAGLKSLS